MGARTYNLRKENKNKDGKKYLVSEETKLRQMLYAERKSWSEERKKLRNEIIRLEAEKGSFRHSGLQRMSILKRDIANGFESVLNENGGSGVKSNINVKKEKDGKKMDYSRQQR